MVKNVSQVSMVLKTAEISLFVKESMTQQQTQTLVKRLALYPEIDKVEFISKGDALTEFKQVSGFGQALEYLDADHCLMLLSLRLPFVTVNQMQQSNYLKN